MTEVTTERMRELNVIDMQDLLMDLSVQLDSYNSELGTLSDRPTKRRARLEERIREVRGYIDQVAKRLVEENPEIRCAPDGSLTLLPTINEPLAMYFVDSNAFRILVLAPTAKVAATTVEKVVDQVREGNLEPKVCRCLKKYVNGKPIKIRGVYFICDLAEAVQDG